MHKLKLMDGDKEAKAKPYYECSEAYIFTGGINYFGRKRSMPIRLAHLTATYSGSSIDEVRVMIQFPIVYAGVS